MPVITRKIGQNRGKPRLWLEGNFLETVGLPHGTQWTLVARDGCLTIQIGALEGQRTRKVAGKPGRPVIDIVAASLDPLRLAGGSMPEQVNLIFEPGEGIILIVRPVTIARAAYLANASSIATIAAE